jgi:hypothetical protein
MYKRGRKENKKKTKTQQKFKTKIIRTILGWDLKTY